MLTTSVSRSLKRSNSASYAGSCAEQTLLKAKGTKASTTFFLLRNSFRRHSSLPDFRVKSGAISPTCRVAVSDRLLSDIKSYPSLHRFSCSYRRAQRKVTSLVYQSSWNWNVHV